MAYSYKGQNVTVVLSYSSHVVVADKDGNRFSVAPGSLTEIPDEVPSVATDKPATEAASNLIEFPREERKLVNLNQLKAEGIAEALKIVPGLGRVTLKTIVLNRPEEGYKDLADLKERLKDKIRQNIKWEIVDDLITF